MKKVFAFLTAIFIFFSVCGCNLSSDNSPTHFKGLTDASSKKDVVELYGEPDEVKEALYPQDYTYDYYEISFLGNKGKMEFHYHEGTDELFRADFLIDSNDFSSNDEYIQAVNKHIKHFSEKLSDFNKYDMSTKEKTNISWTKENVNYSYMIYGSETYDEIDGKIENFRECMIFQFSEYPKPENE